VHLILFIEPFLYLSRKIGGAGGHEGKVNNSDTESKYCTFLLVCPTLKMLIPIQNSDYYRLGSVRGIEGDGIIGTKM
jgi:hypothetical protein